MDSYIGRTIALYGDTGAGKTAQAGEYAKYVKKTRNKKAVLFCSDRGGYDTIAPLVRAGLIEVVELGPGDDPWIWIAEASKGKGYSPSEVGLVIYDSATSQGECLLRAAASSPFQIGQRPVQKFAVSRGTQTLSVANNTDAHYGVIQTFLADAMWDSSWLTRKGIDVLWTFSTHRSEEQDRTPVIGPKLAGKALTASIPKWFKYCFRIVSIAQDDTNAPIHRLYLAEHAELAGLGHSFGNARVPLDATPLPVYIEPASIIEAMLAIDAAQKEADVKLAAEFNGE